MIDICGLREGQLHSLWLKPVALLSNTGPSDNPSVNIFCRKSARSLGFNQGKTMKCEKLWNVLFRNKKKLNKSYSLWRKRHISHLPVNFAPTSSLWLFTLCWWYPDIRPCRLVLSVLALVCCGLLWFACLLVMESMWGLWWYSGKYPCHIDYTLSFSCYQDCGFKFCLY